MSRFTRLLSWPGAALVAVCFAVSARGLADENAARPQQSLLSGWRFHRGSVAGGAAADFDDRSWQTVDLPHTWNARDGQDGGGDYYQGDGWYRRSVHVDPRWQGKRIYLQFDGANRTAEVFLNGRKVGEHRGGTARFRFDVTEPLAIAGDNLLAVRVNNDPHDNIPPVSGDFTFCGGLYRAVTLVATDPVHIDLLDYAAPGVYARPADVSDASAKLDVQVKLANDTAEPQPVTVRVVLLDAKGDTVRTTLLPATVPSHGRAEVTRRLVIAQPHLWNGLADPYLYHLRTEVLVRDEVRDTVTLPVGLRYFSIDPEKGFFLNGRYLDLRGVNRHQERMDQGWAISDADEREDFALIRELGATAIRESHYQQSQLWQTLADEQGMILWAELSYVNDVRDNADFFASARTQLRELIRQNYHHPAICFWSIGNETFVRDGTTTAPDANDRLLAELAAVARQEDDTRLSTYASNGDVREARASFPDVIGFNHYFGWYHGTPEEFARWADAQHQARPDLRMAMSEFGAGANVAQHELPPKQPQASGAWHPEEWQAIYHEVYWQAMAARPWLWGKFIWCLFDFASDGRDEGGTPGRNDKGLVTADRKVRKDAFYWYKANWSSDPVLHITSRRFSLRTNPVTEVKIYSNADAVELALNSRPLGRVTSTNHIFRWPEVHLSPGRNVVRATAQRAGAALTDECTWELQGAN